MQSFALEMHNPTMANTSDGQASESGSHVSTASETQRRSFPLSFAQQRLWVLDRLEPGNGVYNLAFAVRLAGAVDPAAPQRAMVCGGPDASKISSFLRFHSSKPRGLAGERTRSSNSWGHTPGPL